MKHSAPPFPPPNSPPPEPELGSVVTTRSMLTTESLVKLERLGRTRGVSADTMLDHLVNNCSALCGRIDPFSQHYQALTPKQKIVIQHLRSGNSVKEIATEMRISEQTVRTHVHRARGVLGCSDILSLRFH